MRETTTPKRRVRGRPFRKGYDPRRHTFTWEECSEGFFAALASIATRNPRVPLHNTLEYFMRRRQCGA